MNPEEQKDVRTSMSPSIGKLAFALSKAQIKIEGAKKDSENPFFKSSYADLSSVWDACHTHLNEQEIAVVQLMEDGADKVTVVTMLVHSSGEWMRSNLSMTPKDKTPQGVGSAITYARRYALAAITGVCPVDDDAEAAHGREHVPAPEKKEKPLNERLKNDIANIITALGFNPKSPEEWRACIKTMTDLELEDKNFGEILSRLSVLKKDKTSTQ